MDEDKKKDNQKTGTPNQKSVLTTHSTENMYLQIIPIKIQMTNTYALLDSGSQSTLIREGLTKHLKLKTGRTKIKISAVNGDSINRKLP